MNAKTKPDEVEPFLKVHQRAMEKADEFFSTLTLCDGEGDVVNEDPRVQHMAHESAYKEAIAAYEKTYVEAFKKAAQGWAFVAGYSPRKAA